MRAEEPGRSPDRISRAAPVHDAARRGLPQGQQSFSQTQRRSFAEGEAKGKVEGEAKGEAKGKVEGEAKALLRVLARRGITVSDVHRERILTCADFATLEAWLDRAVTASSDDEIFG